MPNTQEYIKKLNDTFLEKECLYKESGEVQKVCVKNIDVSDWGVKFQLKVIDANFLDDDWEYEVDEERLNRRFEFSAAWGIESFKQFTFHAAYVNGTLNSNPISIKLFEQGHEHVLNMWNGVE